MANITIQVKGMHCPSCEMLLKEVLEETPGVRKADFSWKKGAGLVEFDESQVSPDKMKMLVETEGYQVTTTK